ncbi:hypothetical protein AC1031_003153 [Aphanomyces cochlioides]|nr:hypothetical protein AC1031_003153 [Aphanomyces cochlioides]
MELDRSSSTSMVLGGVCLLVGTIGLFRDEIAAPFKTILVFSGYISLVPIATCIIAFLLDTKLKREEKTPLLTCRAEGPSRLAKHRLHVYLYLTHFLTTWGDRMWQYAIPVLLTQLYPSTILPNVLFQLVVYLVLVVSMPYVGQFVDTTNRWIVIRTGILGMNSMVWISTGGFAAAVYFIEDDVMPIVCIALVLLASAVGQIFSDLQTLSLEKDWVVELAVVTNSPLSTWNTMLLRIDLVTRLVSPMVFTFFLDKTSSMTPHEAIWLLVGVAIWNTLLCPLAYALATDVYALYPSLAGPKRKVAISYAAMWNSYVHHPTFGVSFSFCALYMTVLKANALSSTYLLWHGTSASILGYNMAVAAFSGLASTFMYSRLLQWSRESDKLVVISVWIYSACVVPAGVIWIWPQDVRTNFVLLAVLSGSQFWLWTTTLAEVQVMQEWVEPEHRGLVNAMQHTVNKGFFIALLLFGIMWPHPADFGNLVAISVLATVVAALGFTVWYAKRVNS